MPEKKNAGKWVGSGGPEKAGNKGPDRGQLAGRRLALSMTAGILTDVGPSWQDVDVGRGQALCAVPAMRSRIAGTAQRACSGLLSETHLSRLDKCLHLDGILHTQASFRRRWQCRPLSAEQLKSPRRHCSHRARQQGSAGCRLANRGSFSVPPKSGRFSRTAILARDRRIDEQCLGRAALSAARFKIIDNRANATLVETTNTNDG